MANPSPKAIDAIRAFVGGLPGGWPARTDLEVMNDANHPDRDNKADRPWTPQPYTPDDVLGCLSPGSAANLMLFAGITALLDDIVAQASARVAATFLLLRFGGKIKPEELDAVRQVLEATEPDPGWPEHVGWAEQELGRRLDPDDAAASRPGKASP